MGAFDEFVRTLESLVNDEVSDAQIRETMETLLYIRPKSGTRLIPFHLNPTQEAFWGKRSNKTYVLKSRQSGQTTLTLAEMFARCILLPNQYCLVLAHRAESTERIFQIAMTFYHNLPAAVKNQLNGGRRPQVLSKREISFAANNSRLAVATAGSPDAARGLTLTYALLSEFAYWNTEAENAFSALMAAVVPNGIVRIETTPNVAASFPYQFWKRSVSGETGFSSYFLPWWDDVQNVAKEEIPPEEWTEEERTLASRVHLTGYQIAWRRQKMAEQHALFRKEYPEDSESGWLHSGETVFSVDRILDCWARDVPDPATASSEVLLPGERWLVPREQCETRLRDGARFVIGADPAEGTPDGDFSAVQVLERKTGEQVYAAHLRVPVYQFASHIAELGRALGNALLVVERNNHGHAVLQRLLNELNYPNLYFGDDGVPGSLMSAKAKALLITEMDRSFWEKSIVLRDPSTFNDLRSYVYNDRRQAQASAGAHDDLVTALLHANLGLVMTGGSLRYNEISYPKPPDMLEGTTQQELWYMAGPGVGYNGMLPFLPDVVHPTAPELGTPESQRPWGCVRCGGTEIRIIGPNVSCAGCGALLKQSELNAVMNTPKRVYGFAPGAR